MKDTYEYKIFSSHEHFINSNLKKEKENGWEECGACYVHYHGNPTNAAFIYIPMRRLIEVK